MPACRGSSRNTRTRPAGDEIGGVELRRAGGARPGRWERQGGQVNFTQVISVRSDDGRALVQLLEEWDRGQAVTDIMGYMGTRLLADRDDPGHYLIVADFASIDEMVSSADEAELNNRREETERWAQKLRRLVEGEPEWVHYDEYYRTGLSGELRTFESD